MYKPLIRFLSSYGYDPSLQPNPLLLINIINRFDDSELEANVEANSYQKNCLLLQEFFNSNSSDICVLSELTFNYVAKRSPSPDKVIIRVLKSFHYDISQFKQLIMNGVLFSLIVHSYEETFKESFDILLRTYKNPKNEEEIKHNLKLSLFFINKLGSVLVTDGDFIDERVVPFVLFELGQIEDELTGFKDYLQIDAEFQDYKHDISGCVTPLTKIEKNCVLLYGIVTEQAKFEVLYNIMISCENEKLIISKEEIAELQKAGETLVIIGKENFSDINTNIVKIGFPNAELEEDAVKEIMDWLK